MNNPHGLPESFRGNDGLPIPKPPLGVKPYNLHLSHRAQELMRAIQDYHVESRCLSDNLYVRHIELMAEWAAELAENLKEQRRIMKP